MSRTRWMLVGVFAVFLLGLPSLASAVTTHPVNVQNFSFTPDPQMIAVGDSVQWNWVNGGHTTTSDDGLWSQVIDSTHTSYTRQFNSAGEFRYHCNVHPNQMTGDIIVGSVFDFDSPGYSVGESDGSVTIQVFRIGSFAGAASVDYHTADGTATAGQDYTATSGTLTWAAGQGGGRTFTVDITPDSQPEGDETVELTIDNPTGGAVGATGTAELTIQDDDVTYQPDLLVKGPGKTSYIGDNVYNTLVGQTSSTRVKKGKSKTFYVKFENDGNDSDQFSIRGKHGTTAFSVHYFHGTQNISRTIIAGAGQTPVLGPGAAWIMKVVVAPKRAARVGDSFSDLISGQSQSDATMRDRVQLNAKVAAS